MVWITQLCSMISGASAEEAGMTEEAQQGPFVQGLNSSLHSIRWG